MDENNLSIQQFELLKYVITKLDSWRYFKYDFEQVVDIIREDKMLMFEYDIEKIPYQIKLKLQERD